MQGITTVRQVGALLSARRKQLALTQAQVASKIGLSQNRLSVLESKPGSLTVEQLVALLQVLGLTMQVDERVATRSRSDW